MKLVSILLSTFTKQEKFKGKPQLSYESYIIIAAVVHPPTCLLLFHTKEFYESHCRVDALISHCIFKFIAITAHYYKFS